jgi:phosphoglycolate phosphatase-like HAD superfamily hydrolase
MSSGTRLALFDADGVLLDSLTPHLQICEAKNREYDLGLTIPTADEMKEMIRRKVRISPMKYFFTAVGFPDDLAERADRDYQATFARDYASPVYPGVPEALAALRDAGFTLGIVTANTHANVVAALGPTAALFGADLILAKDNHPGPKSDAIRTAMSLHGATPARTVYIGDQPADWEAARTAGVPFVGAAYGWGFAADGNPFPVVTEPRELPACLSHLLPPDETLSTCPGCGLVAPGQDGPCDPYGGSSPACWATFNAILVKDYGEYEYPAVHRMIVDAYMTQHANFATPAGRRSVIVHLVGLHLVLERGMEGKAVGAVLDQLFPDKRDAPPLAPRPPAGPLTIAHLQAATDLEDHDRRGRAWAQSVWTMWAPHHHQVRALADAAIDRSQRMRR